MGYRRRVSALPYHRCLPCRVLTVVALAPVLLGHPISFLSNAGSWAAQQGADGWLQYALACIFTSAACSASLASSYGGEAAHRSANEARSRLALQARIGEGQLGEPHAVERDSNDPRVVPMQAARSQALLETAMPSEVAQALLRGVPMQKLSESYDSASVAFIALAGFDARMARMAPKEQLQVRPSKIECGVYSVHHARCCHACSG